MDKKPRQSRIRDIGSLKELGAPQPAVIGIGYCPDTKTLNLHPLLEECRNSCGFRRILNERREKKRTVPPARDSDIALFKAIKEGDQDAVKKAIESGASVNCKNVHGERPIDMASRMGELEIFVILKKHGASY